MIRFNNTTFVTSAVASKVLPKVLPEVVIVGRSNVGKSSVINALCNQKKLAKTSSTPGRTRLINYFEVDETIYLVDLPGYGYAKGSKDEQAEWDTMMASYFENNINIKLAIVLIDMRRDVMVDDYRMLSFLWDNDIPYTIALTKSDKLSNNEKYVRIRQLCQQLKMNNDKLIITSAEKKKGIDDLINDIQKKLTV